MILSAMVAVVVVAVATLIGDVTAAAVVAGVFSVINTILNLRILKLSATVHTNVGTATEVAVAVAHDVHKVAEVVHLRDGDMQTGPEDLCDSHKHGRREGDGG